MGALGHRGRHLRRWVGSTDREREENEEGELDCGRFRYFVRIDGAKRQRDV